MSMKWTTIRQDDGGTYQYAFDDRCLVVATGESDSAEKPKNKLWFSRAMCEWIRDHGIPLLDKHFGSRPVEKESSMLRNRWHEMGVLEVAREFFPDGNPAGLAIRMGSGERPLGLSGRTCWINNLGVQKMTAVLVGETQYTGNRTLKPSDPHRFCRPDFGLDIKSSKDIKEAMERKGRFAAYALIRDAYDEKARPIDLERPIVESLIKQIKESVKERVDKSGDPTGSELDDDVLPYVREDLSIWFSAMYEQLKVTFAGKNIICEIKKYRFFWDESVAGARLSHGGILGAEVVKTTSASS